MSTATDRVRGASESESERRRVRTDDFDESVASLRAVFGKVELRRDESRDTHLTMLSVRSDDVAAMRWSVRGVAGSSLDQRDQARPAFLTGVRLGGQAAIWSRDGSIDADRPFLYPDLVHSRLAEPDIANLAVPASAVHRAAAAMTGDPEIRVRFTGTAPADPSLDAAWRGTMIYATKTLECLVGRADVTLSQVGLVDHVAMTLLRVFPNSALEIEERQRTGRALHPTLRRAQQFIEDNLGNAFTVPELASAARVSLRGLHAVFRRELDTTPMAYVTTTRLAAARADLEREDPTTTTVPEVAMRWGFANTTHFIRRYRETFQERPAETLRR